MRKDAIPAQVLEYFREQGAKGGKLSGKARMQKLTPEQRSAIAKKAAAKSAIVRSKKAAAKKKAKSSGPASINRTRKQDERERRKDEK